ncbi:MAG: Putative sulfatase [Petrotoga mobilis]|nr:MAG: Putative sulfatase [Petrotoga mobilis]
MFFERRSKLASKNINVILILSDEHRFDCIGAYGNNEVNTPHIDQIAQEGTIFDNAFCTYPLCTPSRYSLLTGLYAHQHMGISNHSTIPKNLDTLPGILRENGYYTTAIGKMHFTPTYLDIGFQAMYLAEQNGPGRYVDDYHNYLKDKGLLDEIDVIDQIDEYRNMAGNEYWENFGALKSNLNEEDYSTSWIAKKAIEKIDSWSARNNYFMMIGFIKPHHPFDPPEPWDKIYDPANLSLLEGWTDKCLELDLKKYKGYFPNQKLDKSLMKEILAYYYATISHVDFWIGKIIDKLKEKKLYDKTLIIYTSDHGDYMGYHHMVLKGGYMYEPLIRIPLIIKYPYSSNNKTSSNLVNSLDISKTILSQCNIYKDQFSQGTDLKNGKIQRDAIFAEDINSYMVRTQSYKLILNKNGENLLFDLDKDPVELFNVYDHKSYSEIRENLKNRIMDWILFESAPHSYIDEKANLVYNLEDKGNEMRKYIKKNLNNFY